MTKNQSTEEKEYTERLLKISEVWWKRFFDVQRPYRLKLLSLKPGLTLEIGSGIGRQLKNLGGLGVGIDHNESSVQYARSLGLKSFLPAEFEASEYNQTSRFDSLLFSHLLEHMKVEEGVELIRRYLPLLKVGGKVIVITPQEAGYKSDPTHVEFIDFNKLQQIVARLDLKLLRACSFPFPRFMGRIFIYNEFISVSQKLS